MKVFVKETNRNYANLMKMAAVFTVPGQPVPPGFTGLKVEFESTRRKMRRKAQPNCSVLSSTALFAIRTKSILTPGKSRF